jgi:predicted MPP superfamily phosphohydrolase
MGPEEPVLLLAHHPDFFAEAAYAGVDLTLSGHTHGGQITWFGRPIAPALHHTQLGYWQGLHALEGAQLLVGRGAGVCLLPIRIAAPAEVLLVRLRVEGGPVPHC